MPYVHKSIIDTDHAPADTAETVILKDNGAPAFMAAMDARNHGMGNRAFMRWLGELHASGRHGDGQGETTGVRPEPRTAWPDAASGPLQLMPKKKNKKAAPETQQETPPETGAPAVAGVGATAEAPVLPEPAATPEQEESGAAVAAPGKKKKKKSRVQVALNILRAQDVAAFGSYIEAEIAEVGLLDTLRARINRAQDLAGVRKEALGVVEGRLRLLASGGDTGVPGAAAPAPGRQAPEFAVLAPVKSELTWMERECFKACLNGDIRNFRRFFRRGNVDVNMGNAFGPLLCVAAYSGHAGIVGELLLVPGIQINLAGQDGITPLYCAALEGHVKVVELLLAETGINANLATASGVTPLYAATLHGHTGVVMLLLAASGINVNPVIPENNSTPLQCAIFLGFEDISGLLLAAPGIDIDSHIGDGSSVLFIAAQLGFLEIVKQLVERGVAVNPASADGATPLYAAINTGNVQVVRILLTARDTRINQATGEGIAPLGFAVSRGHIDIVELLLRHGADPNTKGMGGLTALHIACLHGHPAIVRMLLDDGADADAEAEDPDSEGLMRTPYSLAELGGQREIMSILAAHRRRREAARPRPERLPITGEPGKTAPAPPGSLVPQSLPLAQAGGQASQGRPVARAGGQAASPDALSSPGATAGRQGERTSPAPPQSEVTGEQDAAGQATAHVSPVPPTPSPPPEALAGAEPPTPLAQARDALRQEVLGKLRADNFDWLEGIRLLQDVNDTDDLDSLCVLYNRLAHIERIKERARRRKRRRQVLPVPAGAVPAAADPAAAPVFALDGNTGLDAERVEVEIKRHLGQKYHRFVSQAVNDMEFGRGKPTTGHPDLRHVSAGIPGVGSCSVFYYLDAAGGGIRIVGIGRHVGRAVYELDYAAGKLGKAGRILRIA